MKKPLFCLLTVLTPFLLLESTPAGACTNFIVTRGASTDSTTLVSYSADSHALYGCLYKFNAPKGGFRPGEMLSVYGALSGRHPAGGTSLFHGGEHERTFAHHH